MRVRLLDRELPTRQSNPEPFSCRLCHSQTPQPESMLQETHIEPVLRLMGRFQRQVVPMSVYIAQGLTLAAAAGFFSIIINLNSQLTKSRCAMEVPSAVSTSP